MLYLVAALLLVTAIVMLQLSGKKSETRQSRDAASSAKATSQYASVRLCCDRHACASAQELKDKVFLASEALALPLAGCDAPHCQCKYAKASDRRATGGRRAVDLGIQPLIFDGTENRSDERRTS